jgi:hypothetical protein
VEALRKNETQDETRFPTKIGGKSSLGANYFQLQIFLFAVMHLIPYNAATGSYRLEPPDFMDNSIVAFMLWEGKNLMGLYIEAVLFVHKHLLWILEVG